MLGHQTGNFAYADSTDSTTRTSGILTNGKLNATGPLNSGDVIDIKVDFDKKQVHFWRNQEYISAYPAPYLVEGAIYPAASISFDSEVIISNDPMPDFIRQVGSAPIKKVVKATVTDTITWAWGRCANGIEVKGNKINRREVTGIKNPTILGSTPLSASKPWIRFIPRKLGIWIALGVVEGSFLLNGGKVLGQDDSCFNVGYLDQPTKNIKTIYVNTSKIPVGLPQLAVGEPLDIKVDFVNKSVLFWKNNQYLGSAVISSSNMTTLYPAVQLSKDTEVELVTSGKIPDLPTF